MGWSDGLVDWQEVEGPGRVPMTGQRPWQEGQILVPSILLFGSHCALSAFTPAGSSKG